MPGEWRPEKAPIRSQNQALQRASLPGRTEGLGGLSGKASKTHENKDLFATICLA
jgi:hypothetical protein